MTKSQLKTGHRVTCRNGKIAFVSLNSNYATPNILTGGDFDGMLYLSDYNEDLSRRDESKRNEWDIMKVETLSVCQSFNKAATAQHIDWIREESPTITIGSYTAIVNINEKTVTVGCQTIPFSQVDALYSLIHK